MAIEIHNLTDCRSVWL